MKKHYAVFLLLLLIAAVILKLDLHEKLFQNAKNQNEQKSGPRIGRIASLKNTTSYKDSSEIEWVEAKLDQDIHVGDSFLTADNSFGKIEFENKSTVDVGENSLVVFSSVGDDDSFQLKEGNFKLAFNGNLNVKIGNEVVQLKSDANGESSEFQAFIKKDSAPVIKAVKGKIKLKKIDTKTKQTSRTIELDEKVSHVALQEKQAVIYDLALKSIAVPTNLSSSINEDLGVGRDLASAGKVALPPEPPPVPVEPELGQLNQPELKPRETEVWLDGKYALAQVAVTSPDQAELLVEKATDPFFSDKSTFYVSEDRKTFDTELYGVGNHYLRACYWNQKRSECRSPYSKAIKIKSIKPSFLVKPEFDKNPYEFMITEPERLSWSSKNSNVNWNIQVFDNDNQVVETAKTQDNFYDWKPKQPGQYKVRIYAANRFSKTEAVTVARVSEPPPPPAPPAPKLAKVESSSVMKIKDIKYTRQPRDQVHMEVQQSTVFLNTDANGQKNLQQATLGFAVGAEFWKNIHGFSGSISIDDQTKTINADLLYLLRLPQNFYDVDFRLFTGIGHTQKKQQATTNQYQMVWLGLQGEYYFTDKLFNRSSVAYGYGLESSKKYVIDSSMRYDVTRKINTGVGYKVQLLDAGSPKATPGPLPFREGNSTIYFNFSQGF